MTTAAAPTLLDAVRAYVRRGYRVVPIPARSKAPAGIFAVGWQTLRLELQQLPANFGGDWSNVGIILGEPSGWLVDVDLDCEEAVRLADEHLPPTPLITGRPSRPRSHRWYICEGATTRRHQDPVTRAAIVEIRSTGAQTVVGPSVHPDGEIYDMLDVGVEPARIDAAALAAYVEALADAVIRERHGNQATSSQPVALPDGSFVNPATGEVVEPGPTPVRSAPVLSPPTADVLRRAQAYLDRMPPAISGSGGHNATYAAATSMVHGFGLEPEAAFRLLADRYNPRCQPPWSDRELWHKVQDAANKPHDKPFGWLRDAGGAAASMAPEALGVDLSGLLGGGSASYVQHTQQLLTKVAASIGVPAPTFEAAASSSSSGPADPGLLPVEALRVPGFVGQVMDYCLETAPYPNPVLAFCGALALQAFLAGRKVRDAADNRTNLYILGLAHSGSGKDWPRKINARILQAVSLGSRLSDRMASGEGLQDALCATPAMLFQTDEMDTLLQSINRSRDARHETIMATLLTLYSSASSIYPMRRKAGQSENTTIDQPCLCIFGTAIPNHYYAALSERMLTNGLFARMLIFESGRRGTGQEPTIGELPEPILATAKYWADLRAGGNMADTHPVPKVVECTAEAQRLLAEQRRAADVAYDEALERSDAVATTVWSRANEQVRKLALIYAISETPRTPQVGVSAVRWATLIVTHQIRRMLFQASQHAAETEFEETALKLLRRLHEAPQGIPHQTLLKRMKLKSRVFEEVINTLKDRGDIEETLGETSGRPSRIYRISGG